MCKKRTVLGTNFDSRLLGGDGVDGEVDLFDEALVVAIEEVHVEEELIADLEVGDAELERVVIDGEDLLDGERIAAFLAGMEDRELVGAVLFGPEVVPYFTVPRFGIAGRLGIERELEAEFDATGDDPRRFDHAHGLVSVSQALQATIFSLRWPLPA